MRNQNFNQDKNTGWFFKRMLYIFIGLALTIGGIILTAETSILINLFVPILPIGLIMLYVFIKN